MKKKLILKKMYIERIKMNSSGSNITSFNKNTTNINKKPKYKKVDNVNMIRNNQGSTTNKTNFDNTKHNLTLVIKNHTYKNKSFTMKTKIIQNPRDEKITIKRTITWKENDNKKKRIELQEFNID
jgi:hypothetical protein